MFKETRSRIQQWRNRRWLESAAYNVVVSDTVRIHGDVRKNIRVGQTVRIDDYTVIVATGELVLGSYVHIAHACQIRSGGGIQIGAFVGLAAGVHVWSTSDDFSGRTSSCAMLPEHPIHRRPIRAKVSIGRHSILGAGVIVLPGSVIGEGVAVGAGSVVSGKLDPWTICVGSPARKVKERDRTCGKILDVNADGHLVFRVDDENRVGLY